VPIYPQVACWLETAQGAYVATIYVTAKGARNSWVAEPGVERPEALPVWSHRVLDNPGVDARSGATPAGKTSVWSPLGDNLEAGDYVVKLEVNRSYDYNDRYPQAETGVNGQPSLVYQARLRVGAEAARVPLQPWGTGSVQGDSGEVDLGLEGLTSALDLLQSAEVAYRP
jgi:hypothetical protein